MKMGVKMMLKYYDGGNLTAQDFGYFHARDILEMHVSTVASEAAFSTGGRTLDQFRNSLTPKVIYLYLYLLTKYISYLFILYIHMYEFCLKVKVVQGLICGQDWLRAKLKNDRDKVVNVEESLKELEDLEEGI